MSLGQSFTLKILHDTFLKVSTASSSSLTATQKVAVKAGETVEIKSYELNAGHFRVQLAQAISPVGETGYFYEKHIELIPNLVNCTFNSSNSVEPPPGFGLLTILETTKIKAKPEDSSQLSDREQAELQAGQTFLITGHACVSSHFLVSLSEEIPGFGNRGYLYHPHVSLKKDGLAIDYDPNAITLTILQNNPFKKQPIDSSQLPPEDTILPQIWGDLWRSQLCNGSGTFKNFPDRKPATIWQYRLSFSRFCPIKSGQYRN